MVHRSDLDLESHPEIGGSGTPPRPIVSRELSFSNGISAAGSRPQDFEEEEDEILDTSHGAFSFMRLSTYEDKDQVTTTTSGNFWQRKNDDFRDSKGGDDECGSDDFCLEGNGSMQDVSLNTTRASIIRTVLITLSYILLWYTLSTCLTLYNKHLLGKKYGRFPAPLMMNTIHFSMQAVVSSLLLRFCFPALRPTSPMSWKDYFVRVVPTGVATALDVDLTNASLVFITVTFVTMCKSATPVFLLMFAFLFKLETPSFKLLGIIVIISSGVLLTVAKETEFELVGFVLVMLAAVTSGFRWVVTQLLLQRKEYGLNNPLAAMSYFTPIMAVVTAVFSLILEPWHELGHSDYFNTRSHTLESCLLMLAGGTLAFFMVMAEYILISKTSALTMTVAGVVKEIVTIVGAVLYFGDPFTLFKCLGLIVIIVGVSLFNWFKYVSLLETEVRKEKNLDGGIQIVKTEPKYTILTDDSIV